MKHTVLNYSSLFQVIVKSTVAPWNNDLLLTDAFRGPLAESFKIMEVIHNYQNYNRYQNYGLEFFEIF